MPTQTKLTLLLVTVLTCSFARAENTPFSGMNLEQFEQKAEIKQQTFSNNPFAKSNNQTNVADLKLYAVIFNETNSAALINSNVVQIGDKINNYEVVAISPGYAVIRGPAGIFTLSFDGQAKNDKK